MSYLWTKHLQSTGSRGSELGIELAMSGIPIFSWDAFVTTAEFGTQIKALLTLGSW